MLFPTFLIFSPSFLKFSPVFVSYFPLFLTLNSVLLVYGIYFQLPCSPWWVLWRTTSLRLATMFPLTLKLLFSFNASMMTTMGMENSTKVWTRLWFISTLYYTCVRMKATCWCSLLLKMSMTMCKWWLRCSFPMLLTQKAQLMQLLCKMSITRNCCKMATKMSRYISNISAVLWKW